MIGLGDKDGMPTHPSKEEWERWGELRLELDRDWLARTNHLGAVLKAEGKPDLASVPYKRKQPWMES